VDGRARTYAREATVSIPAPGSEVMRFVCRPEFLPTVLGRIQDVRPVNAAEAIWTLATPRAPHVRRRMRQTCEPGKVTYEAVHGPPFLVALEITPTSTDCCSVRVRRETAAPVTLADRIDSHVFGRWLPLSDAVRLRAVFA
jgi:hypothetical protein